MKTLVVAAHTPGPLENGADGCSARWGHHGMCPGVAVAAWLNGLGDDDAPYGTTRYTAGQVRDNYLRSFAHVVAREPELAKLAQQRRELQRSLRIVNQRIAAIKRAKEVDIPPGKSDNDIIGTGRS